MATPFGKQNALPQSSAPPSSGTTASARLERSHPGVRRSTPDSDALASSDDDGDHIAPHITVPPTKPARRTSWLNEIPLSAQRKHSLPGGPLTSAPSNPVSPASEQGPWASSTTSPGLSGSFNWNQGSGSSFPWGNAIWNAESRKEPPSRLSELVPSPTMTTPSLASNTMGEELLSPITRTISGESAIPFSIPLHPTPKTYRSQSYSVGQMDPEYLALMASKHGASTQYPGNRPRGPGQLASGQPRASRPSVLGELGHDPATLGRVREDDDDENLHGSDGDTSFSVSQARTIEQLARENAILRQQAAAGARDGRFRDRASSTAGILNGLHAAHRIHTGLPEEEEEEEEVAVEDLGELRDIQGYGSMRGGARRRFSEHSSNVEPQFAALSSPIENRALENVRKAHWQTSLGFPGAADLPQSRRHSFADVPVRHSSIGSLDVHATAAARAVSRERDDGLGSINDYAVSPLQSQPYFAREQTLRGDGSSGIPASLNQYVLPGGYGRQPATFSHNPQNQLLYIVTFKCQRADVFYIQEDTGLQVKVGDLVIVEADRGTDLGTVRHANVSLQKARELKQQYAEEHYKCLMMFSRQGQLEGFNPSGTGFNPRSAMGAMGPHAHGAPETTTDIKPKLIKRLAQHHEVLTLRDKEGNEAKAKRVCQTKVAEHRLNMEILDAEFQMDWKKLTFYYFADSYINFNSLVTDLFKIYKTRIWMSAINPASFVTPPTAGLSGSPVVMGNQAYSQDPTHFDRRLQPEARAYPGSREDVARDGMANPAGLVRSPYADAYSAFAQASRPYDAPTADPFGPYSPTSFGPMDSGLAEYPGNGMAPNGPVRMPTSTHGEWVGRFQGLSLNS
ncbi:PSP1 C-terminal domain-containing protein [Penicillium ucsense]|uniref:PSP1 C-terminal domain-containing protein n=1 Tax=Penicillium ucsense TaxID=2839758 RepID=A0A8J8VVK4_9EURO|nr:PSP1 C-terminal domain-containing protein [Penicillium ucsense]KAF7736124.1 PSP1 C-terminal domain-containing protein [Penicillium ucsense]